MNSELRNDDTLAILQARFEHELYDTPTPPTAPRLLPLRRTFRPPRYSPGQVVRNNLNTIMNGSVQSRALVPDANGEPIWVYTIQIPTPNNPIPGAFRTVVVREGNVHLPEIQEADLAAGGTRTRQNRKKKKMYSVKKSRRNRSKRRTSRRR